MSESASPTLLNRFLATPRVVQWAVLAALGMILFFAWDQLLHPVAAGWNRSADAIVAHIAEVRKSAAVATDLRNIQDVVTGLGPVHAPSGPAEGARAVSDLVNQVVQKNAATNYSFDFRSRGKLSKTSLVGVVPTNKRVERFNGDLKFDATPQATIAIIAELESSPDIESVNSVRINKDTGGKVKVHLTIEAWVLASDTAPKGDSS